MQRVIHTLRLHPDAKKGDLHSSMSVRPPLLSLSVAPATRISSSSIMANATKLSVVLVILMIGKVEASQVVGMGNYGVVDQFPATDEDNGLNILPATTRAERFPGREERLRLYMSNWYLPPCSNSDAKDDTKVSYKWDRTASFPQVQILFHHATANPKNDPRVVNTANSSTWTIDSTISPDTLLALHADTVADCLHDTPQETAYANRVQFRKNMNMYCTDAARTLGPAIVHTGLEKASKEIKAQLKRTLKEVDDVPILVQFGDLPHSHHFGTVEIPHLKKFRVAAAHDHAVLSLDQCRKGPATPLATVQTYDVHTNSPYILQPIIWKLASRRHFGNLDQVYQEDTPWDRKRNSAVFRGQMTGSRREGFDKHMSNEENCLRLARCRLVYTHGKSKLIDARLTSTRKRLPETLNGVDLMAKAVAIRRLLEHKGIIMLEGNDVASGLKWALLSQSVVLMPIPQHTSWAMEELLEPWVHYVPLNENATDVEAKMQWVVENDETARKISERASLWMEDLVFHPDAMEDDKWIQEEIIRRYRRHFREG